MIEYKIYKSVYEDMVSGKKNIELRLLNDKSNNIKKGDTIKFNVLDSVQYLIVKVTDKYVFNSIDELWENKDIILNNTLNNTKEEFAELFCQIFGREEVMNSKIVGIKFELIEIN